MGTGSTSKGAFGPGIGLAHELGLAMADENITPAMIQQVISNPLRKAEVGAVIRGELSLTQVRFEDLLARETRITKIFCETAGITYPEDIDIHKALRKKESQFGSISAHDRFIFGGLKRSQLLDVCRHFGIKLYQNDPKTADNDGVDMPTDAGIFTLDYATLMMPTDAEHRPFMQSFDQQWAWACDMGGNGFSTAEETLYLIIRTKIELGLIPFTGGGIRCQNTFGSDLSLSVGFDAEYGLSINSWDRMHRRWLLWALPRKFVLS